MIKCHVCGQKLASNIVLCNYCGSKIMNNNSQSEEIIDKCKYTKGTNNINHLKNNGFDNGFNLHDDFVPDIKPKTKIHGGGDKFFTIGLGMSKTVKIIIIICVILLALMGMVK